MGRWSLSMSAKDICLFRTLVAIVDDDLAGREALSEPPSGDGRRVSYI